MNRRKQLKMIENYIQKHGVKRLAADQRGNDEITRDGDLKLKKLKVQFLRERNKRNKAFKLLNED
tara:strand:+ start:3142 stop:3336 length:195 start_codon:yes stop_codon:yes gene_type:complete